MIAGFLSNISAKYYKNPSVLSRVIAKNVGMFFLRHSVVIKYLYLTVNPIVAEQIYITPELCPCRRCQRIFIHQL